MLCEVQMMMLLLVTRTGTHELYKIVHADTEQRVEADYVRKYRNPARHEGHAGDPPATPS